jgi:hypothetical protein
MTMAVLKDSSTSLPSFHILSTYIISYCMYGQGYNSAKPTTYKEIVHKFMPIKMDEDCSLAADRYATGLASLWHVCQHQL